MVDRDDARISDEILLGRVAAGDSSAFDSLVRRHQASVYRFAQAVVPGNGDAEKVLRETFQAARRGAARFRDERSARPWLLTLARGAAERLHPRSSRDPDSTALRDLARAAGWPNGGAMLNATADGFRTALDSLSPDDREILLLRDREKLGTEEAGRVTGLTEAAVRTRLHRARLRLLAKLNEGAGHAG